MKLDPKALISQFGEMQQQLQETLASIRAEGSAGGGMVKVVCDGQGEVLSIKVDPEVIDPGEAELLEDLVRAAVNEARSDARARAGEEVRKIFGGLPFSGLLGGLPV